MFISDNYQYQAFQFAFYTLANVFLKASLALTFNRILLERWQRLTVQVTVAINTIFGLTFFFVTIFRCGNPMDFDNRYNHSMCLAWEAMQGLQYTNSIVNTLADWILAIVPIFALRAMKMNHQAKVSACFILVLGCISSIMSMPRFGFISGLGGAGGQFWTMAYPVAVLGVAEVGTGATAACLLTLRPLIRSWREHSASTSQSSNHKHDDEEKAEVCEARAVSLKSVSATSVALSTHDSMHKIKDVPATVVIETAEVNPTHSTQLSAAEASHLRRRSSCIPTTLESPNEHYNASISISTPITEELSPEAHPSSPQAPPLTHRMTEDSDVISWRQARAATPSAPKTVKETKRLTWNDMHAQWNNLHSSRTACHGPMSSDVAVQEKEVQKEEKREEKKEEFKPKRMSIKRVSGILREWSWPNSN
jgi:hypothetical protein